MPASQQRPASQYQRNAFAPGILAAICCLAGTGLLEHEWYFGVRFAITMFALIIGWFAVQARQWWWLPLLLAIAVVWNPILPFPFAGPLWIGAHVAAATVFVLAGASIKTPRQQPPARSKR